MPGRIHDRLIVEDADRPVSEAASPEGTAEIVIDDPEHVEVEAEVRGSSAIYLVLADTFDPGWTCEVDGQPATIRPAYSAFRAVPLRPGHHRVKFVYEPAGFRVGLALSGVGLILVATCLAWPRAVGAIDPPHGPSPWPRWWPVAFGLVLLVFCLLSAFRPASTGGLEVQPRWEGSFHRFTWAAGIEAIRPMSKSIGR